MVFTTNLVSRVPVAYATAIGRIISRWAGVEWELQRIVYLLLDINAKQGRLAAKVPRAGECAHLIKHLAKLRGITLDAKAVKDFQTELLNGVEWRDRLAHGVWLRQPKNPRIFLQVTKGAWNDPGGTGGSRKILPEGMPLTIAELRAITEQIELVGGQAYNLYRFLRQKLRASRKKPEPPPHGRISLDTGPLKKPKHPQKASRG